jgi:hypothetical protein
MFVILVMGTLRGGFGLLGREDDVFGFAIIENDIGSELERKGVLGCR